MTDIKENTSLLVENREIKFRAVRCDLEGNRYDDNRFAYGDLAQGLEDKGLCYVDGYLCSRNTTGQYTGLKDKNGVEIYEGDIVNIEDQDYTEKTLGIIQRAQGGFDIDRTMYGKNRGGHNLYFLSPYLMVVGNIYQNKNLLS